MSSRRLLIVLQHLPDESAFKTAVRGGRQTRAQRIHEEIFNEALRLRASYETIASHGQVSWDAADFAWLDPVDARERAEQIAAEDEEEHAASEDFYSDLGFT